MADEQRTRNSQTPKNDKDKDDKDATIAQRMEKFAAGGMRDHLRKTGGAPTAKQTIGSPATMLQTAIVEHDDHANNAPAPMAMLAGKVRLATGAASHIKQVGTRSFSNAYLEGREEGKARQANTVSIPKADIADPAVAAQLKADLKHLARNPETALDKKNIMTGEAIDRKLNVARNWPGDNVTFLMENMGLARNPEIAKNLSEYAKGGRERLVEAGLLPPLERGREQATPGQANDGRGATDATRLGTGRSTVDDAMAKGAEFRKTALPRPNTAIVPRRGGVEM